MSKIKKRKTTLSGSEFIADLVEILRDKYFNLFLNQYQFEGDEIDYRKNRFILKNLYYKGQISAFKSPKLDTLEFADFSVNGYDLYDMPINARPINKRSSRLIPNATLEVDKDIVICYLLKSHEPVLTTIDWYIERLALVEGVIRTNLYTHNSPFLLALSPEDKVKLNTIIQQLFSLDPAIAIDFNSIDKLQLLNLNPTYIIDKLYKYKKDLENDLLTYLGINNTGLEKQERMLVDEVNANNEEIENNSDKFLKPLEEFCERIKDTLGFTISVKRIETPKEDIEYDPIQKDDEK